MPTSSSWGKRLMRYFLWTSAGISVFSVLLIVSSRVATQNVWRTIEDEKATGLSSPLPFLAQSGSLLRSLDDLQIVRAASLVLGSPDFDSARNKMDVVIRDQKGYLDELRLGVLQGTGRTLTATIRVPVEKFDLTLVQLRAIGNAEQESQSTAESTAT
jgi:hypothetical protein